MILSSDIWTVGSHTVLYLECIINNSDLLVMNMSTTYIDIICGGNFQRQTFSCLGAVEKVIPTSSWSKVLTCGFALSPILLSQLVWTVSFLWSQHHLHTCKWLQWHMMHIPLGLIISCITEMHPISLIKELLEHRNWTLQSSLIRTFLVTENRARQTDLSHYTSLLIRLER